MYVYHINAAHCVLLSSSSSSLLFIFILIVRPMRVSHTKWLRLQSSFWGLCALSFESNFSTLCSTRTHPPPHLFSLVNSDCTVYRYVSYSFFYNRLLLDFFFVGGKIVIYSPNTIFYSLFWHQINMCSQKWMILFCSFRRFEKELVNKIWSAFFWS